MNIKTTNKSITNRSFVGKPRRQYTKKTVITALCISTAIAICGCQSRSKKMSPEGLENNRALNSREQIPSMEVGSETEKTALKLFEDFYSEYSTESIKKGVRLVYAADAWFGDPFKTVDGIDAIEHYFLAMAEPVEECSFTIDATQRCEKDYYFRWTMILVSKAAKTERIKTIGMSHVRYNTEGKIVFQQDYWDTGAMFERMPVVGFWTRFAKRRIEKKMEK